MSGLKDQALVVVMENLKLDMLENMNKKSCKEIEWSSKTIPPPAPPGRFHAIVPRNYLFLNTVKRKCRLDHPFCVLAATSKELQAFNDKRTSFIRRHYIQDECYRDHCYNLINQKTVMFAICKDFWDLLPTYLQPHPFTNIIESVHFIEDVDASGLDDSFIVCRLQECDAVIQTSHMAFETRSFTSNTVLFDKNSDGSKTKTDCITLNSLQWSILEFLKDKLEDVLDDVKNNPYSFTTEKLNK